MSTKRKAPGKIAQPVVKKDAKKPVKVKINEADTAVSTIGLSKEAGDDDDENVIEISSDAGSSADDLSDEEMLNGDAPSATEPQTKSREANSSTKNHEQDTEMNSPNAGGDGDSDQDLPADSFGDLARANETIDVPSTLSAHQSNALTPAGRSLVPPNSSSLGTVLTQALRTDDVDLLESCLHTTDVNTVRNTIQRLDSLLAGVLLTKLASRMHRRPGRAGSLMAWVQWTLIAHGSALAMQPGVTKKLSELHKVLEERSRGLNSLLSLKGKLHLLDAQLQLRQQFRQDAGLDDEDEEGLDDDDDEGVVYMEGEESEGDLAGAMDSDDDEILVTNGMPEIGEDSEDEESGSEDDEEEDLEGEEDLDENEVNHDDVESEDDDSEMEAMPPAKRSKGQSSKRR